MPQTEMMQMNKENQIDAVRWTAAVSLFSLIVLGVLWEMVLFNRRLSIATTTLYF